MFHISDLTFLRNKHGWMDGTSRRRNLTTTIVFDEFTGRKRRAGASIGAVYAITCCAVALIPSNSNDTASATGSAEASQFAIGCRTRIAT